jgi:RNA polymerase subunit RPABC4/transcription elongation factor Spt4
MSAARVCPECGELAGNQPFCAACGKNLTNEDRLPSRTEWEAAHAAVEPEATVCAECLTRVHQDLASCPQCGSIRQLHLPASEADDPDAVRAAVQARWARPAHVEPTVEALWSYLRRYRWLAIGVAAIAAVAVVAIAASGGGGSTIPSGGFVATKIQGETGSQTHCVRLHHDAQFQYECDEVGFDGTADRCGRKYDVSVTEGGEVTYVDDPASGVCPMVGG